MSNPQGKRVRNTDSVQATPQGIKRVRDRVRDRILQERQHQREEGRQSTYTREDLAEQIGLGIDTLKRFFFFF